jgi:outer membrane receptor protein involved in Fe transport
LFEFGGQPGNYGGLAPLFNTDYHPTIWSVYADDQWDVSSRLKVRPGVRVESVPIARFTGVAPRASFKLLLTHDKALTGSLGRYHQAVHSLRDQELPITVYEFWIGADEFVPVARSDHAVLGYEQWFERGFQVDVEAYLKTYRNLVIPNSAQSLRDVGNQYRLMEGESWGVDVLLRRHVGRFKGWVSYGFAKTERRAGEMRFPPAHDRRHTVNVVLSAPGPLGSELGLRWGLGSPLPYTGLNGEWSHRQYLLSEHAFGNGETEPIGAAINAERFPTYSRLDLGLRWQFEKWGIQWNPYFQVANVYNRRNVFVYVFDYGARPATRSGVAQVPLFPSFGIEFKW